MSKRFIFLLGLVIFWVSCTPVDSYEQPPDDRRRSAPHDDTPALSADEFNFDYVEEDSGSDDQPEDRGSFSVDQQKKGERKKEYSSSRDVFESRSHYSSDGKKIDFLFVLDGSPKNTPFLRKDNVDSKFNSFISKLHENGIDWRFYFLSASSNGKPFFLERDGVLIRTNFLSSKNLEPYNLLEDNIHFVFVDTMAYNAVSPSTSSSCHLPPYCHNEKQNQPLLSLKKFFTGYKNVLRDDAALVTVVISSNDEAPSRKADPVEALEVINVLNEELSSKEFFSISIVVKVGESGTCKNSRLRPSSHIPQLSLLSKGTVINICSKQHDGYGKPIIDFLTKKLQE